MGKCGPISEPDIKCAYSDNATELRSWEGDDTVSETLTMAKARTHINRIATLMRQESAFDRIVIMLENHTLPIKTSLNDGNHRLSAAYIRGDDSILAIIAATNPSAISNVFPSAFKLDDEGVA